MPFLLLQSDCLGAMREEKNNDEIKMSDIMR